MYILINEQKIEITGLPTVQRSNNDGHLTLKATIPMENLTATEIFVLCASIKENAPVIEVYKDEEKVQIYEGFNLYPLYSPNKTMTAWELTIENESELKYQYGLLKKRAETLEKLNAELTSTVNAQTTEIFAQAEVIVAQGETIAVQNEQVAALMEASASQLGAIDSIMTEVIPLVAQEAATLAVEQALAAIAEAATPETSEEETPVEETENVVEETETTEEE